MNASNIATSYKMILRYNMAQNAMIYTCQKIVFDQYYIHHLHNNMNTYGVSCELSDILNEIYAEE